MPNQGATVLRFSKISVLCSLKNSTVVFNLFLLRLGYAPDFIGQVSSAGLIFFALCSLPAGAIGDRLGNRRAMIIGLTIMMVSNFSMVLVEFVPPSLQSGWLFGAYIVSYSGVALYFVNTAPFLMASITDAQRSYAFSIQSAMISFAAFIGSILGGLLPAFFARLLSLNLDSAIPYRYPLLLASLSISVGIFALSRIEDEAPRTSLTLPPWARRAYGPLELASSQFL